jgi:hypothetical protein
MATSMASHRGLLLPWRSARLLNVCRVSRATSNRCARQGIIALAYPSAKAQQDDTTSDRAAVVIERPSRNTTPSSSVDAPFSPETLDSAGAIDEAVLRSRIAQISAAEISAAEEGGHSSGSGGAADQPGGMSASLKGMLLLNLGAALFGSNMVRRHCSTAHPVPAVPLAAQSADHAADSWCPLLW